MFDHAAAAAGRDGLGVQAVSDALRTLLQAGGVGDAMEGWRAVQGWGDWVGPRVARRTRAVSFHQGTLVVEVEGSSWRHELGFLKRELLDQISRHLGSRAVRDLRFVTSTGGGNRR